MFCKNCGKEISDNAHACPSCGEPSVRTGMGREVDKTMAAVLAFFLGSIGIHDFVLGRVGLGIIKILLCWTGVSCIWACIDIFMISKGTYATGSGIQLVGDGGTARILGIVYAVLLALGVLLVLGFFVFALFAASI